jgi:dTDP-4-dehydrorhamnose reductase
LPGQPLLVTGASGTLGSAFGRICRARGLPCHLLTRQEMDIADARSVRAALDRLQPWAVINAAGYVRIDEAERDPDRCRRENVLGPLTLAGECEHRGLRLMIFSSDLVFGGERQCPYTESDSVNPLNVYGQTKVEAEKLVVDACRSAAVIRTSALFGPWDELNFVTSVLRRLALDQPVVASPLIVSPTYIPDLIHACLDLLVDGATGIWHLAGLGEASWVQLARAAAKSAALNGDLVEARPRRANGAPRPAYSALGSERATLLPPWEHALERYFSERAAAA